MLNLVNPVGAGRWVIGGEGRQGSIKLAPVAGKPLTHTLDQCGECRRLSAFWEFGLLTFGGASRHEPGATTLRKLPSQLTEIRTPAISIRVAHKITRYPTANFARRSASSA